MTIVIQSLHHQVIALVGWIIRHQQSIIDYLIEEKRVPKHQLEGRQLQFTEEQRRLLAAKYSMKLGHF